jgi:hypothetical protein
MTDIKVEIKEAAAGPAYPSARTAAGIVQKHLIRQRAAAQQQSPVPAVPELAPQPDLCAIEAIIDAAFWASLQREEGFSPKISLAFLPPERAGQPVRFERRLPLTPNALSRLAPAVEPAGIHLGVWGAPEELCVWGTTRTLPKLCLVVEVIEPGLLVVKHPRGQGTGKFVNVVVLKGDQIKEVDEEGASLPDCPGFLTSLLGFGSPVRGTDSVNVLVRLAVAMRAHGRGGSLLVVPHGSERWRESIVRPIAYSISPSYCELADLMRQDPKERTERLWQESFIDAVEAIAGLTGVDGAMVISDQYELLAFGAKITRRGEARVEQVVMTEPVIGGGITVAHPLEFGGTRHLSAAQFAQDQQDSMALVASQDGRFTVFAWSPCEGMVHAHRVETLLM